jgi:hypothetical protein
LERCRNGATGQGSRRFGKSREADVTGSAGESTLFFIHTFSTLLAHVCIASLVFLKQAATPREATD